MFKLPQTCQYCGQEYPRSEPHHDQCLNIPLRCPYRCGVRVERTALKPHFKVCTKLQVRPSRNTKRADEVDHSSFEGDSHGDNPSFLPAGYKLLSIARKMLRQRSQLPELQLSLMETRTELKLQEAKYSKWQKEGSNGQLEEVNLEQAQEELKDREEKLENELEDIERKMAALRCDLHKTHRSRKTIPSLS